MATSWGQLGKKIIGEAQLKEVPVVGQFELTTRCNLQCKMCYVSRAANDRIALAKERSAKEWISLAQEAREAGMLYLLLTGGEIFLRSDFNIIYKELSNMGFNIELYTNATMITPEIAKWLGKTPPSKIGITLYGASPESYEKVCGNANAYYSATRGTDLLLGEGINLWLKTTVIRDNVNDFDELAEFSEKRGINFGVVNYISPRREGCNTCPEMQRLSPKELLEYEIHADKYFKDKPRAIPDNKQSDEYYDEITTTNIHPLHNIEKSSFSCPSGKSAFWITWDGRMTPCSLMNTPESFPFENGFITSWKEIQNLCSSVPSCKECKECSLKAYCMSCPARLQAETGSFNKPAEYLCELARLKKNLY